MGGDKERGVIYKAVEWVEKGYNERKEEDVRKGRCVERMALVKWKSTRRNWKKDMDREKVDRQEEGED